MKKAIKITDDDGNEIFLVTVNVINPAEHIDAARQIASEYQRTVARVKDWQPEKCQVIKLSPTGQLPATHYLCSMQVNTFEVKQMEKWIKGDGKTDWRAKKERQLTDNLLDAFLVCVASREDFLTTAGLQVIQ